MIRSILCVCQANISRSPMLEAWIKKVTGEHDVRVESGGTFVDVPDQYLNNPANEKAIACMKKSDMDISKHRSRPLSTININDFDLIVCISPQLAHQVIDLKPRGAVIVALPEKGGLPEIHHGGPEGYDECSKCCEAVARDILATFIC